MTSAIPVPVQIYEIHIFELRIKMELYVDHLVPSVLIRSSNI